MYSGVTRKLTPDVRRGRDKIACMESLERHRELVGKVCAVFPKGGNAPAVDGIKELPGIGRVSEAVGETIMRNRVVYVPLPSGASTWLNVPENRGRLLRALAVLGEVVAAGRIGGF